jgi:PqqD family protein of HPr-rel-A system
VPESALPPFAASRNDVWSLNPQHATQWREWDGEVVVYDDRSGDTLKLDVIAAETFKRLTLGPVRQDDIVQHLATILGLEPDPRLYRLTEITLERLQSSHLVLVEKAKRTAQPPRW